MIQKRKHTNIQNWKLALKLTLMWLIVPICSMAQQQKIGIPYVKNYSASEYNAHVQNFDVVQDHRGVMFFANFRGILEFDGQNWLTIQTSNISQVTSLAIDSIGTIYVGGRGEIGFLRPDSIQGKLLFYSLMNSLSEEFKHFQSTINTLATPDGIYFVTDNSILLWDGKSFKETKTENTITSSFYVNEKLYFFEKNKGLQFLLHSQKFDVDTQNKLSSAVDINAMLSYGPASVLIATGSYGLFILNEKGIENFKTSQDDYLRQNNISCATILKDKTLVIGTERGGLVVLHPDGSLKQVINKGIRNNYIRALYSDRADGLWLALDNGISQLELPCYLSFFDEKQGIEGAVNQVLRIKGDLFFATNKGLFHFNKTANLYRPVKGINAACWSILSDKNGLLAATSKGIYSIANNETKLIAQGFSFKLFRSDFDDSNIYIGQLDGISHLKRINSRWVPKGKIGGISDEISEIQEDENGYLWLVVATRGVLKYNPNKNEPAILYDETKGLPSRFGNHLNKIGNTLLVSTQHGMFVFDPTTDAFSPLKQIKQDTLLTQQWLSLIVEDAKGNLWSNIGDETHISFNKTNEKDTLVHTLLMPIQEKTVWSIYPETDGKVWFGGPEGAICFDPEIEKNLSIETKVSVRSVKINNDSLLFGGIYLLDSIHTSTIQPEIFKPKLFYSLNSLTFKFACPSFCINEKIEFQYYLEGFDETWSPWNKATSKEYTNLSAGEYTFNVRAKNVYGIVSETSAFHFSIKKPFYQTLVAYLLYALILIGIILIIVRLRSQKLIKEKRDLENRIEERTAEVVSQKEEIEKQTLQLSNKNEELEKINLIVKSINSEIHFTNLLQSILEKTKVIGGVEKATMLVHEKSTGLFSYKAAFGWDVSTVSHIHLTLSEAEEFYLMHADEVYEDIFDVRQINFDLDHAINQKIEPAKSISIMMVRVNDVVEGFLILENMHNKNAFDQQDFSLLRNLKEHIISAFIKTIILEDLQTTLENLKETQEQLIQQEKLASIGQLTKGIVDRILNPLNYINNFSLLTNDLAIEMEEILECFKESIHTNWYDDLVDLLYMVKSNVLKVNEHGNSASRIVKGMEKLLKERSTKFIETDINKLVDSHVEIALQKYKTNNKEFNTQLITNFDTKAEKISVLPAELGSVIDNTFENACFAVEEKMKKHKDFQPEIVVSTHFSEEQIEIIIRDNGTGIPESELKKLFSPFFTTKPTAKGTGLGLYLNMDIIKSHKGTIKVESKEGEFTAFIIQLPKNTMV